MQQNGDPPAAHRRQMIINGYPQSSLVIAWQPTCRSSASSAIKCNQVQSACNHLQIVRVENALTRLVHPREERGGLCYEFLLRGRARGGGGGGGVFARL